MVKQAQEQDEQREQQKSSVDRANDLINKGQSVRNKYKKAKGIYRTIRAARTAAVAGQGVTAAAATSEVWVPVLVILLLLLLVVVIIVTIFSGNPPATCEEIVASKNSASIDSPVTLTLENCNNVVTTSWSASIQGGTFSPSNATTTLYTPFSVSAPTNVEITAKVCGQTSSLCSEYSITIVVLDVSDYTCPNSSLNQYCSPEGCADDETFGVGTCPGPTRCCRASITCANVDRQLREDFGVIIKPVTEAVSCTVKKRIHQIYSLPGQSPEYLKRLKPGTPFTLEFYSGSYGSASGYTPSGYKIRVYGFASFLSNPNWFRMGAFFLIHETGHLIGHRNYALKYSFPLSTLVSRDSNCYQKSYLKTYSLRCGSSCGITPLSESFAESQGLYVFNSKVGRHATIYNFRSECDATYSWIRSNLFGNISIRP